MFGLIWTRQSVKIKSGILSIMVGRPRKTGKRKPCGRLAQVYVNPKAQVANQPHRVVVPLKFRDWPEAETAFGRMMVNSAGVPFKEAIERGLVTPARYEAGKRYAELYRDYQRALFAPGHNPKAMNYQHRISGKSDGVPDSVAEHARKAWTDAFNKIEMVAWQQAVMHHAVHDRAVSDNRDITMLNCGLDRLVKHFGIDEKLQITPSRA